MPAVVVKTGPQAGRRVEMGVQMTIGRLDGDLVLEDPEVSRHHAVLRRSGESVLVEDLDSTNGTFVNGERIRSPITVDPGDQVRVGQTTLEIEPDPGADATIASTPLRPDQIRSAEARASGGAVEEDEEATQPLPFRAVASDLRPARSNSRWFAIGAVVLAAVVGVVVYAGLVHHPGESDFAAGASDACAALLRSDGGVDLSRTPTRGALEHARNLRLQALGAIRALERPKQDAVLVAKFLSAFGETNASITRLEGVIGADNRKVARALRGLRADVRDERQLAATAGLVGCGGLGIR